MEQATTQTTHPRANTYPTQETRIFAAEEIQLRKDTQQKLALRKEKKEIYDRIDTPLLFIGQAVDELGVDTYNIAARPEIAEPPPYDKVVRALEERLGRSIGTGRFGADMQVSLTNDGPVTIWIDSKARE